MKIVRVIYEVRPEYAEQNKANVEAVMSDLRSINNPGVKYATYVQEDGVTFMHFAQFQSEEDNQVLNDLDSFKKFRLELKESQPVQPPSATPLSLVAAGFDLF